MTRLKPFTDLLLIATLWDTITLTLMYQAYGLQGIVLALVFEIAGAALVIAVALRLETGLVSIRDLVNSRLNTPVLYSEEEESDEYETEQTEGAEADRY